MRDFLTKLILTGTAILLTASAFAADVQMTIQPQLISLLDRAVLKIEFIDTKGDAVDIPNVEGLEIQYQGQSSETRIVNFKSTSKVIHNYLVTPTKIGDYTIGPVTCKFKGGQKKVSTKLRVIKPKDDPEAQEISKMLFSRISSDREAPYVHEPFGLEVKVYIRDDIQIDGNFSLHGGLPESGLDGELNWNVSRPVRVEHDGQIFKVYQLRTTAKTLTAGTFEFQPQIQVNVVVPRQRRRSYGFDDPFFGDFFGRQERRPIVLDCNRLDLEVKPVPLDGRPESFTGGVGEFNFTAAVGPKAVKRGEPVTIKMRITGKGNITKITPPSLETNHEFKLYDARTLPTDAPNEVCFEQVIIPTTDTITNVPAISFSYFNTQTADFRTITQGPFPIRVDAAPQQAAQVIASVPGTIMGETEILGRDIIYLKPAPKTWKHAGDQAWHNTRLGRILLPLPALLLAITAGIAARRNRLAGDIALARRQKAPKAARRNIQLAEQAMRKADEAAFYEALWNALADYFGHRLNLPPGDVNLQSVQNRIPEESETLATLFNTIKQRRYAFGGTSDNPQEEMKNLLKQCNTTLRKCERMKL